MIRWVSVDQKSSPLAILRAKLPVLLSRWSSSTQVPLRCGPHSFGVLSSQGRVELFQLCNRRPQLIARAPQRFRRALLRRADPNHEQCREREKRDSQCAIGSYEERMHRRDEEVIESENGEPDSKQARTDPSKPGGEQHRTKKQRDERRSLQKSVHR